MRIRVRQIGVAAFVVAFLSLTGCSDVVDKGLIAGPAAADLRVPGPPPPPGYWTTFLEISAGYSHTCARTRIGAIYCWGDNGSGQVGVPSTGLCGVFGFGRTPCVNRPTFVTSASFSGGMTVRAGGQHTCAVDFGNAAWCWGGDWYGEIGDGGTSGYLTFVSAPAAVQGGLSFASIAAGEINTCGVTTNNMLFCWGSGVATPGLASGIASWAGPLSVSTGSTHACGKLLTGPWACWGQNGDGELGLHPDEWPSIQSPVNNFITTNALNVQAGNAFTCADQPGDVIMCLGRNTHGQLGDPTFSAAMSDLARIVGRGTGLLLHGVAVGFTHACALDQSGAAWCWGDNALGQLGDGGSPGGIFNEPVPVAGGHTYRALAAGRNHTCAIGTDNHIYCWGDNAAGQLGLPGAPLHGQVSPVQALDP